MLLFSWLLGLSALRQGKAIRLASCVVTRTGGILKPWPNGLASRHKLKTWVYLRLHLARACVHLR